MNKRKIDQLDHISNLEDNIFNWLTIGSPNTFGLYYIMDQYLDYHDVKNIVVVIRKYLKTKNRFSNDLSDIVFVKYLKHRPLYWMNYFRLMTTGYKKSKGKALYTKYSSHNLDMILSALKTHTNLFHFSDQKRVDMSYLMYRNFIVLYFCKFVQNDRIRDSDGNYVANQMNKCEKFIYVSHRMISDWYIIPDKEFYQDIDFDCIKHTIFYLIAKDKSFLTENKKARLVEYIPKLRTLFS
jgi:hypothetical protein